MHCASRWPLLLAGLALAAATPWRAAPAAEHVEELETVLVLGEQPGPGLWKVSRGDHALWLLGTVEPLPKGMKWKSRTVEARVAESQQVLLPGVVDVDANIGVLRGLTLLPAAIKAGKNPGGATLQQVLPPDLYARWRVLREKYIGRDDDIEAWRPTLAIGRLRAVALRKSGLVDGPRVTEAVERAARQHRVRVQRLADVRRTLKVDNARGILKGMQQLQVDDVECFRQTLDQLEPELERTRARANAWSRGDTDQLRALYTDQPAPLEDCARVYEQALQQGGQAGASDARKVIENGRWHAEQARVQLHRNWLAAAEAALASHRSTFAVVPMQALLGRDGYLATLRARGYEITEP